MMLEPESIAEKAAKTLSLLVKQHGLHDSIDDIATSIVSILQNNNINLNVFDLQKILAEIRSRHEISIRIVSTFRDLFNLAIHESIYEFGEFYIDDVEFEAAFPQETLERYGFCVIDYGVNDEKRLSYVLIEFTKSVLGIFASYSLIPKVRIIFKNSDMNTGITITNEYTLSRFRKIELMPDMHNLSTPDILALAGKLESEFQQMQFLYQLEYSERKI